MSTSDESQLTFDVIGNGSREQAAAAAETWLLRLKSNDFGDLLIERVDKVDKVDKVVQKQLSSGAVPSMDPTSMVTTLTSDKDCKSSNSKDLEALEALETGYVVCKGFTEAPCNKFRFLLGVSREHGPLYGDEKASREFPRFDADGFLLAGTGCVVLRRQTRLWVALVKRQKKSSTPWFDLTLPGGFCLPDETPLSTVQSVSERILESSQKRRPRLGSCRTIRWRNGPSTWSMGI